MTAAAPPPLTAEAIHEAIGSACRLAANRSGEAWTLRRADEADLATTAEAASAVVAIVSQPLLFGIIAKYNAAAAADNDSRSDELTTFYLAYSTWDGRVLYIDQTSFEASSGALLVYRTLADLAVKLNCNR